MRKKESRKDTEKINQITIYSDLFTVEEESEHFSSMERQVAIRLLKAYKMTGA